MSSWRVRAMAAGLVVVGCLQLVGDLTGILVLKALGAASHASPAPKVFTAHDGLETFSATFVLGWRDGSGGRQAAVLTPALNRRIRGPYNRRNTFGATLAGAPLLRASPLLKPMHDAMLRHVFCGPRNLLAEIGLPEAKPPFTLDIVLDRPATSPAKGPATWQLQYKVPCDGL
jgi:hypothetical protein